MDAKNQIPLLELQLTTTGETVRLCSYLTTGQSRQLQRLLLADGSLDTETGKLEKLAPETFLAMQDKAAEFLVKEVVGTDGSVTPFTPDWLFNLPVEDGNEVYEKITELINASSLSAAAKKK